MIPANPLSAAKEKEKVQKAQQQVTQVRRFTSKSAAGSPESSRASTPPQTPKKANKHTPTSKLSSSTSATTGDNSRGGQDRDVISTKVQAAVSPDQGQLDMAGLNLEPSGKGDTGTQVEEPPPKVTIAKEKLIEEVKKKWEQEAGTGRKALNLVVIGEVP